MGDDDPGAPGENAPAFSLGWGCAARRPSGGRAAGWMIYGTCPWAGSDRADQVVGFELLRAVRSDSAAPS